MLQFTENVALVAAADSLACGTGAGVQAEFGRVSSVEDTTDGSALARSRAQRHMDGDELASRLARCRRGQFRFVGTDPR